MFAWVIPLLNAIAALPKIASLVDGFAAEVVKWYVKRQNQATLAAFADAAAYASRAQSKEDRLDADEKWAAALSRPRVTPD